MTRRHDLPIFDKGVKPLPRFLERAGIAVFKSQCAFLVRPRSVRFPHSSDMIIVSTKEKASQFIHVVLYFANGFFALLRNM
jgi:hypothetical protein